MKLVRGRPVFVPTAVQREIVKSLLRAGVPLKNCLPHVINPSTEKPLAYKTFIKVFNVEIATSVDLANALVTRNLFKMATGNGPQACDAAKYWLRCKAGWKFASDLHPQHPLTDEPPSVVASEAAVEARIAELWSKYGRRSSAAK
jgi:hypothetical protein